MASVNARVARVSVSMWHEKVVNDPEPTQIGDALKLKALYAPNPARPGQYIIVLAEAAELRAPGGLEGEFFYSVEIPGVWTYSVHVGPMKKGGGVVMGAQTDIPDSDFEALLAQQTLEDRVEQANPASSRLGGTSNS